MTYGHLQADCLYTGISSGPNARCRVWVVFTFLPFNDRKSLGVVSISRLRPPRLIVPDGVIGAYVHMDAVGDVILKVRR